MLGSSQQAWPSVLPEHSGDLSQDSICIRRERDVRARRVLPQSADPSFEGTVRCISNRCCTSSVKAYARRHGVIVGQSSLLSCLRRSRLFGAGCGQLVASYVSAVKSLPKDLRTQSDHWFERPDARRTCWTVDQVLRPQSLERWSLIARVRRARKTGATIACNYRNLMMPGFTDPNCRGCETRAGRVARIQHVLLQRLCPSQVNGEKPVTCQMLRHRLAGCSMRDWSDAMLRQPSHTIAHARWSKHGAFGFVTKSWRTTGDTSRCRRGAADNAASAVGLVSCPGEAFLSWELRVLIIFSY